MRTGAGALQSNDQTDRSRLSRRALFALPIVAPVLIAATVANAHAPVATADPPALTAAAEDLIILIRVQSEQIASLHEHIGRLRALLHRAEVYS
jgi:hypothetical protein